MKLFNIFRKKNKKKEESNVRFSSFSESTTSENYFNASKEATVGREIMNEVLDKRQNLDIEQVKGWIFEAKLTSSYNINSAKSGSNSRAVMYDSKISSKECGVKSDSSSVADIEIVENGNLTGNKIQAKAANNYKNAVKYQNKEKYNGMQRVILEGQKEEFNKDEKLNKKISLDTKKNLTEKIDHKDSEGRVIESDKAKLADIKDKKMAKIDAYLTEVNQTMQLGVKSGANAAGTAFLINLIDDIVENREIDFKKNLKLSGKTGIKVGGTSIAKDIIVNKLKYSAQAFSAAMTALDISNDLKRVSEMYKKGLDKNSIREEVEASIYKAGVGFLSNMALIFPFGAPSSVAINYIGNKLIQKYFYSELALSIREIREKNNEQDRIYQFLQEKERNLNELIEKFTVLIEKTCNERIESIDYLKNNFNSTSIYNVSTKLTKKSIKKTTDREIEKLFEEELSI